MRDGILGCESFEDGWIYNGARVMQVGIRFRVHTDNSGIATTHHIHIMAWGRIQKPT